MKKNVLWPRPHWPHWLATDVAPPLHQYAYESNGKEKGEGHKAINRTKNGRWEHLCAYKLLDSDRQTDRQTDRVRAAVKTLSSRTKKSKCLGCSRTIKYSVLLQRCPISMGVVYFTDKVSQQSRWTRSTSSIAWLQLFVISTRDRVSIFI